MNCFKAYDIRGKVPEELDDKLAYQIGAAYCQVFKPRKVIVGYDVRLESQVLTKALIQGINDNGVDVINIGLCGTEEVYFQTFNLENQGVDGGIMITASHNPKGYNGMKLVQKGSRPISSDTGLFKVRDYIIDNQPFTKQMPGETIIDTDKTGYIEHLLSYINLNTLKPLKIVVNPGNGPAGLVIKLLAEKLPFDIVYINDEPDGNFPNGVPNPLLPENRAVTIEAVKFHKADMGIAWDGDFDRCFLFDENGDFIEGYYIVGLLAEAFLNKYPEEKIIYDPRLNLNTIDIVKQNNGTAIQSKAGHAFFKETMRQENAIYGGEMSAHHYFRDFAYCDSGMIPWLLVAELISIKSKPLSQMLKERIKKFPCSGELNYQVVDTKLTLEKVLKHFVEKNPKIDYTDGISVEFPDYRFNLRASNTEALLRLNVESYQDETLVKEKVREIEGVILHHIK